MCALCMMIPIAGLCGCHGPSPEWKTALGAQPRESIVDSPGRTISYLRGGDADAPRVIYVHGTPGDAGAFLDYVVHPVAGLDAISIDRPGFGETGGPAVPSFESQAKAIEPLLVKHQGRWPILVGHSLGGPIAARVAADYPDRVSGIVIVAGSLDPALEKWKWFNSAGEMLIVQAFLSRGLVHSNQEIRQAKAQTTELAHVLDQIRCPVIIIHGTKDELVPVANVDYMVRMLTNAASIEVEIIENMNHFIPWSAPERIRDAVAKLAVDTTP